MQQFYLKDRGGLNQMDPVQDSFECTSMCPLTECISVSSARQAATVDPMELTLEEHTSSSPAVAFPSLTLTPPPLSLPLSLALSLLLGLWQRLHPPPCASRHNLPWRSGTGYMQMQRNVGQIE